MQKKYDKKKLHRQLVTGWCIAMLGMAIQFVIEKLILDRPAPELAVFIVGIPFLVGGAIFAHGIYTFITCTPITSNINADKDYSAIYQANMYMAQKYQRFGGLLAFGGFISGGFMLYKKVDFFYIGFIAFVIGAITILVSQVRWAKCPACGELPVRKDGQGISLNLDQCPNCGARLK